jgi:hypothetical protein
VSETRKRSHPREPGTYADLAHRDFIRSASRDSRDDIFPDRTLRSTLSTTNTGACPKTMEQHAIDEKNAAELGPRPRSILPSIRAADDNKRDATREPRAALVKECGAQKQGATDSQAMAETSGNVPPRMKDVPIVESLEGSDEDAADALRHNVEASNAAREAPALDSAAGNGADALEASLAPSAGVLRFPQACVRVRTRLCWIPHGHISGEMECVVT